MIVLLDLNFTLVANSAELSRRPQAYRLSHERYRHWLVDLIGRLQPQYTILLTVRDIKDETWTLANIQRRCNWQPDWALFRDVPGMTAPAWKEHALLTKIFPRFGSNGSDYLAIESNLDTQKMYAKNGIRGLKVFPSNEADSFVAPPAD